MCDYSLEMYRSQPAVEGVEYETRRFQSGSIGFTAPADASTAACMACDMRLRLENVPAHVHRSKNVTADEEVTFIRLKTGPYHDGVRFSNGEEVSLQHL